MNYVAAYDNLIRTRKQRVPVAGAYYENHHIVMKSMGGSDEPENLVRLTAREHFLAHWLLWRIHEKHENSAFRQSTALAFSMMRRGNESQERITSARAYEEARKAHGIAMKIFYASEKGKEASIRREKTKRERGVGNSQKGKIWMFHDDFPKSKNVSVEELPKFAASGWKRGRKLTDSGRKAIGSRGKKQSPESIKRRMAAVQAGRSRNSQLRKTIQTQ